MDHTKRFDIQRRWIAWSLIVVALLLIGVVTLTPQESVNAHNELRIIKGWNRAHLREDILNMLLFVPLGIGAAAAHMGCKRLVGFATGVSALIEFLQWSGVVHGRFAELQDLLSNVAGAALGFALIVSVQRLRGTSPRLQDTV